MYIWGEFHAHTAKDNMSYEVSLEARIEQVSAAVTL